MDKYVQTSPVLDEMLLDIATEIELTDHDRQIAERRYERLKAHLERRGSELRPYLLNPASQIYPQGSMSISTTIVSGEKDDRYDIDAIVEIDVPKHWSPSDAMRALSRSLQGFPGSEEIVDCTRCVQIRFAQMHMDVALMDPKKAPRPERQGEIFHVPETGQHRRVPSNPYGFSRWYRENVRVDGSFQKALASRRQQNIHNRLHETAMEKILASTQDDLAPMIPPRLDSEQAVALKLLKRHINIKYRKLDARRPPSIYFTKHSADVGAFDSGLTDQLIALTQYTSGQLRECVSSNTKPDERNPRYSDDRLNDRWPSSQGDMRSCIDILDDLALNLVKAKSMSISEITKLLSRLFGEEISGRAYLTFAKRYDQSTEHKKLNFEKTLGTVLGTGPAIVASNSVSAAPRQNFHYDALPDETIRMIGEHIGGLKNKR